MKLFYPKSHYDNKYRAHVFPLLKPFLKNEEFTDEQRVALYGVSEEDVQFVNELDQAEVVILPMSWNYYLLTKQITLAEELIHNAGKFEKTVWCFLSGDTGVAFPNYDNCILYRTSGARSKSPIDHKGLPVFIKDPLHSNFNKEIVFEREYKLKPTVGFCGLVNSSKFKATIGLVKTVVKNTCYYLRLTPTMPEALISAPYFRFNCLNKIMKSDVINDNFILRDKYRAGAITKLTREQSTREFYNNIIDSDYILCVRGAGNFSVRLYETLAMGRIPVFINTDCILPLESDIDWKKHMVWVEQNELHMLEEKIVSFHKKMNNTTINELFKNNRELWKHSLTLKGFFNTIDTKEKC